MWGVQIVAAECLAHPALLEPIWNHPARENRQKRFVWAPKDLFWGPGDLRRVQGGQISSQLPLIGPPGLNSWSTHTLTWYRAPSGPKGALKGLVFAPKGPFRDLGGSRRAPDGPDLVPTALKWSYGVKLMVTTHFDLISGPLRVPRGPKGVIWAQSQNFHVPIFL